MTPALRILVVDDDELDRTAVRRGLQQAGVRATVDEAHSGEDALRVLETATFDCVILDYYLPGMDSLSLLAHLRGVAGDTPIVILTGRGDEDLAAELMKAGVADYLSKGSMTPERLAASVRHALELAREAIARRRAEEELRAQEERFRTLANAIPQLAWTTDASGGADWFNQRWVEYTGSSVEDARGWAWRSHVHPDHVERVVESMHRSFEHGEPWEHTFPLRAADGTYRWFLSRAVPLKSDDGRVVSWFGTHTDVSARMAAERALGEREAELRALANNLPQLVWIADGEGRRSWTNDRWYELTGLTPEEARGHGWETVVHPEHVERVREGQRAAFAAGRVWEDTAPLRRKDGEYRWFLSRAVPVDDGTGTLVRWCGTDTDITERLAAERMIRDSEERFRKAFDIETVGVVFFDPHVGVITDANDAFLTMCGHDRAAVGAGHVRWDDLTPPEWMPRSMRALEELEATGRTAPYEKEYLRRDGTRWWVLLTARRVSEHECVEFVLDVTQRKHAEAERERLLELERRARGEAERAIRGRDEVLAIVAHDLRNPLQSIMTSASVSAMQIGEERHKRTLKVIERSTKDMDRLITDLLDVARIEAGSYAVRTTPVELRSLFEETVERFEEQARAREISLAFEIAPEVHSVEADRDGLVRVLSNLVGNSLRFVGKGGRILLGARATTAGVELSVMDTGTGIPAEALPHVFDRFWRVDRASRSGAGLGLAICKGIIEAHRGRIWVESVVNQGTTFRFVLPAPLVQ